jgi:hypothetical protein
MMAGIEVPHLPDRQGADPLTMPEVMAYYRVPGVSIAVIHDVAVHWAKSWGVADFESGAPATIETLYQAVLISKPIAAMASLKAIEDGHFGLGRYISTILTSCAIDPPPLTACHYSGGDTSAGASRRAMSELLTACAFATQEGQGLDLGGVQSDTGSWSGCGTKPRSCLLAESQGQVYRALCQPVHRRVRCPMTFAS